MGKVTSAILFAMLSLGALGHMEMVNPLPIRSPEDPKSNNPDYDYVSPLDASGSNYPCKGYHTDPFRATADYQAGQSYTMEIEGGATHEGGSCQLSLSYDNGESFQVIKSMIGGCPLQSSYDFTIPSDAPSGEALFAWSWFNKVGNREMYMNCAFVNIQGSSSKLLARQDTSLSFDSAPSIFIANVNGPGQCTTIEGEDVVFPYPGDEVEGAQDAGEGYTCSGTAPGAPDGDSPDPPSPPTDPAPVPTTEPTQAPTPPPTTTTMVTQPAPPSSTPVPTPTNQPGQCTEGETFCNSPTTWSLCSGGHFVFMGPVAPGMTCEAGSINRAAY
ncbi:hypothetical protein FQN54_009988 [Arachnomyces sp. PD_36]|nr:hypothetical protein FQN54_009988 [Arachnomyces sp. PD_36]